MAEVFNIVNHKVINHVSNIAFVHYIETAKTTKAEAKAADFFLPVRKQLGVGSTIACSVSDGVILLAVTASTAATVTTATIAETA